MRLWRLIEVEDVRALPICRLSIDERVLHFIAGVNGLDMRLRALAGIARAGMLADAQHAAGVRRRPWRASPNSRRSRWCSSGDDAQASATSRPIRSRAPGLYALRWPRPTARRGVAEALATLWDREAALLVRRCCFEVGDASAATPGVGALSSRPRASCWWSLREPLALDRMICARHRQTRRSDQWLLWQRLLDVDSATARSR